VYSVARTWSVVSGWVVPSASFITAVVPGWKKSVACRLPSRSVTTLPRAIPPCAGAGSAIAVTLGSRGIITTSGAEVQSAQGTSTRRWTGSKPLFW
jgi:hypothetical protein